MPTLVFEDGTKVVVRGQDLKPVSLIVRSGGRGAKGEQGDPGREVELGQSATHVQWRYAGDASWTDLVPLSELIGPQGVQGVQGVQGIQGPKGDPGVDGVPGAAGADAYDVAVAQGFVGDRAAWLASLVGAQGDQGPQGIQGIQGPQGIQGAPGADGAPGAPGADGAAGADGREVELQKSATAVQWRYLGDTAWIDLVPLSDITGPAGADGTGGGANLADALKGEWDSGTPYATGDVVLRQGSTYVAEADSTGTDPTSASDANVGSVGPAATRALGGSSNGIAQHFVPTATIQVDKIKVNFYTAPPAGTYRVGVRATLNGSAWLGYVDVVDPGIGDLVVTLLDALTLTGGTAYFVAVYKATPSDAVASVGIDFTAPQAVGGSSSFVYYGTDFSANATVFHMPFTLVQVVPTAAWRVLAHGVREGGTEGQLLARAADGSEEWVDPPQSSPSRSTTAKTTASLAAGAQETGAVLLAAGYRVYRVDTDRPARVRLYTTAAQRDADAGRALGTDPTGDHGLLLEVATTSSLLGLDMSPVVDGFDGKVTPDGQIPITIDNLDSSAGTVTATFTWIRSE